MEDDFDLDGFYRTFSISFDADVFALTNSHDSEVYAELYLSEDGGPWIHYYTTDNFIIQGESEEDEYEVLTTLLNGYNAGYYNVLIDLYEVGYSDIVATYSSDDTVTLYGLPLESADYDEPYVEEVYVEHGGSISFITLLLGLIVILRLMFHYTNLTNYVIISTC